MSIQDGSICATHGPDPDCDCWRSHRGECWAICNDCVPGVLETAPNVVWIGSEMRIASVIAHCQWCGADVSGRPRYATLVAARGTYGKWWWADGHIAGHMHDADESPDGLTLRPECPRCMQLARSENALSVAGETHRTTEGEP